MSISKKSVTVFLSSHNGAKYIKYQIDTILSQRDVSLFLQIRDDGSTDETIDLLNAYKGLDNVSITLGSQCGVGCSFMGMLYECERLSDYYAFADQDDVWDDDKLIVAIRAIEDKGNDPRLYACNQRCVDKDNNYINDRFPINFPPQTLKNTLFVNLYAGCTMVFNKALMERIIDPTRRPDIGFFDHRIHDAWISCVGNIYNPIIFDSSCHMSFRRHERNESDAEIARGKRVSPSVKASLLGRKLKRLKKKTRKTNGVELTAVNLLNGYADKLNEEDKIMLSAVANYRKSHSCKIGLLKSRYFEEAAPEKKADLVLKTLLNDL